MGPVGFGGVCLVGQHRVRAGSRPAATDPLDPQFGEHGDELRTVATLSASHHHRHQFAALLTGQMRFGGPAAPRPTEAMICRFSLHATRRFLLRLAVATGSGRVLVGAADRGVHADGPVDQPGGVCVGL
jgi:hypothetical protein